MSGAETARRRFVQRRTGGAEMALPHVSVLAQPKNMANIWKHFLPIKT